MNNKEIKTIIDGLEALSVIAFYQGEFYKEILDNFIEVYEGLKGDEYKYLLIKAKQVKTMINLEFNAWPMLNKDREYWEHLLIRG